MRGHGRLALSLGLVGCELSLYVVAIVFIALAGDHASDPLLVEATWRLPFLTMGVLGALIVWRRPEHPFGPLLAVAGLPMLGQGAALAYTLYGLGNDGAPLLEPLSWLGYWLWMPASTLLAMTILLFPTGRPPTARWRVVVLAMLVQMAAVTAAALLLLPGWQPEFIDAASPADLPGGATLDIAGNVAFPPLLVAAAAGLIVRYRRSSGMERLQLRWLAFAVSLLASVSASPLFFAMQDPMGNTAYALGVLVAITAIPVSMAIAVLRYRLYDIDRLISRTVSYALLTGVLVGVYALGVLGVGALLPGERSDLLVAGSTLAVAALFRPLRNRIQQLVDRRFNRSRYDAARTVDAFGVRLRDEVDLELLASQLVDVARSTLQPRGVSLWLRRVAR